MVAAVAAAVKTKTKRIFFIGEVAGSAARSLFFSIHSSLLGLRDRSASIPWRLRLCRVDLPKCLRCALSHPPISAFQILGYSWHGTFGSRSHFSKGFKYLPLAV